jgi:(2Fe-2S) ferredoxin
MSESQLFYKKHIFCCTNLRAPESERGCCAAKGSEELLNYFKVRCKELGLKDIRVNHSGCFNRCELGPVMVIYPEGVWYNYQTKEDIERIINDHMLNNKEVLELKLSNNQKTF